MTSLFPTSLTDSMLLDPDPPPSPVAPPATVPAGAAEAQDPPGDPDKVSTGGQQGGVWDAEQILLQLFTLFFQSPGLRRKKSKGMSAPNMIPALLSASPGISSGSGGHTQHLCSQPFPHLAPPSSMTLRQLPILPPLLAPSHPHPHPHWES